MEPLENANNSSIIMYNAKDSLNNIEDRIFCIREVNVMIDRDLAEIYGVKTKRLNEQVKRNIVRFPERYMFQLSDYETLKLVANCDRLQTLKHSSSNPYVFTEQGVSMLEDKQKLFFDGQIYDAFSLMVSIIQKANEEIILIDNYVNNETLDILSKKKETVDVRLFTSKNTKLTKTDIIKFNSQYPNLTLNFTDKFHDKFLIIDNNMTYHIGASIKDAGKKCFGVNQISDQWMVETLLKNIN